MFDSRSAATYNRLGVDVGAIGGDTCIDDSCKRLLRKADRKRRQHTGSTTDVVEGKLSDSGVELQEKRQRLANTTTGTEDGDLGGLRETLISIIEQRVYCRCTRH